MPFLCTSIIGISIDLLLSGRDEDSLRAATEKAPLPWVSCFEEKTLELLNDREVQDLRFVTKGEEILAKMGLIMRRFAARMPSHTSRWLCKATVTSM
jgi:hypothetical protein